jgi:hypothetical protein
MVVLFFMIESPKSVMEEGRYNSNGFSDQEYPKRLGGCYISIAMFLIDLKTGQIPSFSKFTDINHP